MFVAVCGKRPFRDLGPGRQPAPSAGLLGHRFRSRGCRGGVAQVAARDRLQIFIELVEERNPGRDIQVGDLLVGDTVEVLYQCPQTVAMSRYHDPLPRPQVGDDGVVPVRQHPIDHVLETLGGGQKIWGHPPVARIVAGVTLIHRVESRRWGGGGAAPHRDRLICGRWWGVCVGV